MQRDEKTTANESTPQAIDIELLAIDLSSCTRCVGTLGNIESAIEKVRPILDLMEVPVNVRKTVVQSEEQARQHEFSVSPTVRINGRDIAFETLESQCDSCTDLCGCDEGTDCRVWPYRGKEYTEAPVGLVVESILRAIFSEGREEEESSYNGVPENLRRFFDGKAQAQETCCSPAEQETCCEPSEKASCCSSTAPQACGCQ
jgi:hypothetical protein